MIAAELAEAEDFDKSDVAYFRTLLNGAIENAAELQSQIAPFLDRPFSELSPIERGILLLGGYELMRELEVPYRVVINEAVELAKGFRRHRRPQVRERRARQAGCAAARDRSARRAA